MQRGIPEFLETLKRIEKLHKNKNADYAEEGTDYQNFERSSVVSSWFTDDRDKAFAILIGTKLARLGVLLSSGAAPNNESIQDTFDDLTSYSILWGGFRKRNG